MNTSDWLLVGGVLMLIVLVVLVALYPTVVGAVCLAVVATALIFNFRSWLAQRRYR